MPISEQLEAIINAIQVDFAEPDADYRAVRAMFAPFHGHPVGENFEINITEYGGVRCGATPTRAPLQGSHNKYGHNRPYASHEPPSKD